MELPEKVLHLRDGSTVRRPEVYLRDPTVGQGDTVRLKNTAGKQAGFGSLPSPQVATRGF